MSYTNYNHSFGRNRISEPAQLLAGENLFSETTVQKHMLGAFFDLIDGCRFRYLENGTAAVPKALMTLQRYL